MDLSDLQKYMVNQSRIHEIKELRRFRQEAKIRAINRLIIFFSLFVFFGNLYEGKKNRTHDIMIEKEHFNRTEGQLVELRAAHRKIYELIQVIDAQQQQFTYFFNEQQKEIDNLQQLLERQNKAEIYCEESRREANALRRIVYNNRRVINECLGKDSLTRQEYDRRMRRYILEIRYKPSVYMNLDSATLKYLQQAKLDTIK